MFYAQFVLSKKGPLARIWLAAHWDKKLTKAHVFETNIEKSVEGILQPKVKMALRTSGHLLLGVVRIYSRKAKYLLADCNEAFVKIKMAFRPGMVDLPEENREAAVNAITLPEVFHDFDTAMPELNDVDIQAQFSLNQSRAEEITMREDYGNLSLVTGDDGFGDMFGTEPPELMRDTSAIESSLDHANLLFEENGGDAKPPNEPDKEQPQAVAASRSHQSGLELDAPIRDDGFGGNLGQDIMAGGLFEGGLFDDAPMAEPPPLEQSSTVAPEVPEPGPTAAESDDDMIDHYGGPPSVGGHSSGGDSRPPTPVDLPQQEEEPEVPAAPQDESQHQAQDQTTLLQNEDESFALAPVDASALKVGWTKAKRKRKLIVDEVKNISGEEMKAQLSDTSDIITTLDLAPPTKRLMHWKETGGVEKLFALPGRLIPARVLSRIYVRHLTSHAADNEDFGLLGDHERESINLDQVREGDGEPQQVDASTPGLKIIRRKRRQPEVEEQFQQVEEPHKKLREEQPEVPLEATDLVPPQQQVEVPVPPPEPEVPAAPVAAEPVPEVPAPVEPAPVEEPQQQQPPLENLGYDQTNPQMANMGYDENILPAQTPGAVSDKVGGPHSVYSTGGPATPWNQQDYDFPSSVAPVEEQQADETYEQFEERVLNKRAAHMHRIIRSKVGASADFRLRDMTHRNNRKQVAQKFYTLLVLKKLQAVELEQDESYGDILITKGQKFDNAAL